MTPRFATGCGVLCALGAGRQAFASGLRAAAPLAPGRGARAAEVPDFDASRWLGDKGLRTLDRTTKLAVVAARLALADAAIKRDASFVALSPERVGVVCSNAYGSLEAMTELDRVAILEDARYINPSKFPNTVANTAAGYVSIWEDLRALNVSISNGSSGALDAFAMADLFLGERRADALLVGGAEASSEALALAFDEVGASETPARLGEGAAFVVLEREPRAPPLARLAGAASAFDAPAAGRTLHAGRDALERAVAAALDEGGAAGADVDLVASGASGLAAFDRAEIAAIRRAVREDVAIAAPKRLYGEALGAGGALATAAALAYLGGVAPAPLVSGVVRRPVRAVLLTSLGFHGHASAVLWRAPE